MAARGNTQSTTEVGSRAVRRPRTAVSAAGLNGALYCSRETAAGILHVSENGLALAMSRGECEGLYTRVGRSLRFYLPALTLRAAGLSNPADLGAFCKGAGIRDLAGLLDFLGGA